jgi:hypothetical protein
MTIDEQLQMKRIIFEIELNLAKLDVYDQGCFIDSPQKNKLVEKWYRVAISVSEYRQELELFKPFTPVNE